MEKCLLLPLLFALCYHHLNQIIHAYPRPMPQKKMDQTNQQTPIPYNKKLSLALQLPDLPPEQWSDFRREFETHKGITLKEIARKYHCDPRTVRKHLLLNKGSADLGRHLHPTKLTPFLDAIGQMYETYTKTSGSPRGICQISQEITEKLRESGYIGSERSIRNYLRKKYYIVEERTST